MQECLPSGDKILQEHQKNIQIIQAHQKISKYCKNIKKKYPNIARVHADAIVHLLMVHERGLGWDYRSRGEAWPDAPTLYLLSEKSGFLDPSIFLGDFAFRRG